MTYTKDEMSKYQKQYYEKNKLKKKEYANENRQRISINNKKWCEKNKEKLIIYEKERWIKIKNNNQPKPYISSETKQRHKIDCRYNWKKRGVIDNYNDNYETLYTYFISVKNCEKCECVLNTNQLTRKCLDHDHTNGEFRKILCHNCNSVLSK